MNSWPTGSLPDAACIQDAGASGGCPLWWTGDACLEPCLDVYLEA